ncbi:MAG: hypothetical protein ABIP48_33545 [Planctomycetota bacterium]
MKRHARALLLIWVLVGLLGSTKQATGQSVGVHVPENAEDKAVRITVYPAAEPRPALKHQLLPKFLDRTPGNAAVHYGKVTAEQQAIFGSDEVWENVAKWTAAPLADLREEEVPHWVRHGPVFDFLERAARCEHCDWQLPIREQGFYTILLPDAQQARSFARLLAVRARVQIADGDFDAALGTLQSGYALARHVAQGETLVHALIGVAISGMMSQQVQELLQQPDAPNLYWALTMLPRPLIDIRGGIEPEMNAVHLSFPEIRNLEDTTRNSEYWRETLQRFWERLAEFADGSGMMERPEVLTALAIKGYPMAKRALVEWGRSPEEVEAMPVPQVVLLYTAETYEELRDDIFKWFYVPYWETRQGMDSARKNLHQSMMEGREIVPLARLLLPAIGSCAGAIARTDREIAVLRTIEAIRLYAAAHEGRLPGKLADLAVPVPIDPITGQPFAYKLDGETAVIEGPPLPGLILRLEIKVAR